MRAHKRKTLGGYCTCILRPGIMRQKDREACGALEASRLPVREDGSCKLCSVSPSGNIKAPEKMLLF